MIALQALARVFGSTSPRTRARLGAMLGFVACDILRIRRAHVEASLQRIGKGRDVVRAFYRELGVSACEFLSLVRGSDEPLSHVVLEDKSRARVEEIRASGGRIVLAASHTGNWDLAACRVGERYPLTVLTKSLHAAEIDAVWQGARARRGVDLVRAGRGAFATLLSALSRGRMVAVMIDQVPPSKSGALVAPFLGENAWVERTAALLAARAHATILVVAARREGAETLVTVLDEIAPPRRHEGASFVDEATRRATMALDRFVREHPASWLWLHRRWGAPKSGLTEIRDGSKEPYGNRLGSETTSHDKPHDSTDPGVVNAV